MSSKKLKLDLISSPYVFVYGTLKKGFSNHRLLENATYIGKYHTNFNCVMVDYGCPATMPAEMDSTNGPKAPVQGELYKVDEETLARLDRLEGHPNLYYRSIVGIRQPNDWSVKAWMYFYEAEGANFAPINENGMYEWGLAND